jgi:hypothetical protein
MSILLYRKRCKCKEEFSISKPKKPKRKRARKINQYGIPYLKKKKEDDENKEDNKDKEDNEDKDDNEDKEDEVYFYSERFEISYKKNLSSKAKFILNTFEKKHIYYAIDDILYLLKSTPNERNNLLGIIYSPIISLQNNFSVNFFDIWIDDIHIQEIIKKNRFLKNKTKTLKNDHLITIRLFYKIQKPVKNMVW